MATIKPLRGWRYNEEISKDIGEVTSPLFDVVSKKQLKRLYANDLNSIHLSVPRGKLPFDNAKETLAHWKESGIIVQDPLPGIYVYYQYFHLPGETEMRCRKGFICNIQLHEWQDQVILRHENTMPHSVEDREMILEKTQFNVSATHGLYTDEEEQLEAYMEESMLHPIYETEDYQGVRDVLSVIHDAEVIRKFINVLKDKKVILADGHHRYEGSLQHWRKAKSRNESHTGNEGYNYHLMYLTNTEGFESRILPTHRLISGIPGFDEDKLMQRLSEDFAIEPVDDAFDLETVISGKPWTFGLLFQENAYRVRLKAEAISNNPWPFPDAIKELDMTVAHYFIIEKAVGVKGKDQPLSENISFDRSLADCMTQVLKGDAQMAIIVNGLSIDTVKQVCYSGTTLPHKSTFFFPKTICGFVFGSLEDDQAEIPFDTGIG